MKFILNLMRNKNRIASKDKLREQHDTDASILSPKGFDDRNESGTEFLIDFSDALIFETPELQEESTPWQEHPELYGPSSKWLSLIVRAYIVYKKKKYAVARDLFNEAKIIAPLDYQHRPTLFRTLRKLTDPKLIRRLPSLKNVRPVKIQLEIFEELFHLYPE